MGAYDRVADNLATVRQRVADAAKRSGRSPHDVTIVAVTKYVDDDVVRGLVEAGCSTLGESRPQSLWQKAETLGDLTIEWHMIGHLQRNKIRRTLPLLKCIHSADSQRLLDALQQEASRAGHRLEVLLEVNISRDAEKTGLLPEELLPLAGKLDQWSALNICGLMAMSGRGSEQEQVRREFAQVRQLRERLWRESGDNTTLRHLSMGMSDDYSVAIEEGATIVRVGRALYEGVDV